MKSAAIYMMLAGLLMVLTADATFHLFTNDEEFKTHRAIIYGGIFMLVASIAWPYVLWR